MMEPKCIDLCEFLAESELQQYYNSIKNELKITTVVHLKYANDEDLKQIGLSRPEIRRLRKFYDKYYPHGYLSKIKRLLQNPKAFDGNATTPGATSDVMKTTSSPSKVPSNKHIIPPDAICVNKQLGIGEFGIVQQGVWTNGTERIQVAIKCLCRERMQSNPMEFLKEAAIMHSIEHENIVRLYGVVLDTDSLMLVTELAHLRSLLECLKDSGLRVSFLTVPTLCEFAQQICNGMMYLENKRLIHRDLAARNILVFSKNKVKISDFGLSRALGVGKDYYQTNFNVNLKLPIAWCAPECINFLRFTNASDVWAYGVCLWEMFSYGFQPWAALTGHQILEAIDEPNYQRLEPPECCPREYYALMLKCWQHDPNKRPKFSEIYGTLPDMKPEQLKTVTNCGEAKKDHLMYRQGEIVTVLDKGANSPYWKGVLNSGKTGLFNPANTVTYLGSLPSSTNRDAFTRSTDRSSKRKLRTEMISRPQNDLKHTGHVGLDGAYFGDVAFLASSQPYNHLPRQIVTPYKPSEDIEQTPLLHPTTPTSPDSIQTASGYFSENVNASTNHLFTQSNGAVNPLATNFGSYFDFAGGSAAQVPTTTTFSDSNPFASAAKDERDFAHTSGRDGPFSSSDVLHDMFHSEAKGSAKWPETTVDGPHEYHEISDDEMPAEKFDLGPSLLDEMDLMFRSMTATTGNNAQAFGQGPDFEHTNKKNEIAELTSKLARKNSSGAGSSVSSSGNSSNSKAKKKAGTVKPLSVKDDKILNQAIEFANEISARSMTDLVSDGVTQSPKRKFSFRFPNLSVAGSHGGEKDATVNGSGNNSNSNTLTNKERKNFSEELKNVPDLQRFRSLTEIEKCHKQSNIRIPLFDKETADFCFEKSREILTKPFNLPTTPLGGKEEMDRKTRDLIGENLIDIENTLKALNLDFMQTYNELEKTDSAETLFGDANYCVDKNPKIRNSAIKLSKLYDLGNYGVEKMSGRRSQTPEALSFSPKSEQYNNVRRSSASPQEKSFSPRDMKFSSHGYVNLNRESAGFATGKSVMSASPPVRTNYSSNNSIHTLMQMYTTNQAQAMQQQRLMQMENEGTFPHRKRSMSFTENYELKSPPQPLGTAPGQPAFARGQATVRVHVGNKSKSAKARTLRRLSYNPIVLDSSSSSSSESEFDRSIAHSECDIRTKMLTSRRKRQYLNRKSVANSNPDKLYGSNTSIKSAPQYNYSNGREPNRNQGRYGDERFGDYGEDLALRRDIYDYSNGYQKFIQPREFLYPPEFDVSKLTGKSPTTQGFFPPGQPTNGAAGATTSRPVFQWPEKIHASTVKRNDLLWRQRQERNHNVRRSEMPTYELGMGQSFSSDSSSSTETDSVDFQHVGEFPLSTRMPPSPAP
ncbi:activated Cdc42 kinase-like isoform X2 [Phlebotomus argentipes]|uniref:activated Cdc42 kinase-like isoform X2 n=1 Tax=Phlebotomus argentipes TaxID=94469 RepID=UPI002892C920|nr:activated Cdc42 kinase-like isoform X2 [Phlebotomus argentipes]